MKRTYWSKDGLKRSLVSRAFGAYIGVRNFVFGCTFLVAELILKFAVVTVAARRSKIDIRMAPQDDVEDNEDEGAAQKRSLGVSEIRHNGNKGRQTEQEKET